VFTPDEKQKFKTEIYDVVMKYADSKVQMFEDLKDKIMIKSSMYKQVKIIVNKLKQ
jgi:uncharacterized protein YjhX (UPF0386 family)